MRKNLYLVLAESCDEAWWWDFKPSDPLRVMSEITVDVPDLPSKEDIDKYLISNAGSTSKEIRIAQLEEELARLRAQE